jgi:hypothetical protein
LISHSGIPMLSDFGVSRIMAASQVTTETTGVKGSTRWMAIEFMSIDGSSSSQSTTANERTDVWAFGMTVYVSLYKTTSGFSMTGTMQEILTRKRPFYDISNDSRVMFAIMNGLLPTAPDRLEDGPICDQILWNMCQRCWLQDPSLRPLMGDIVAGINNYLRASFRSQSTMLDIHERDFDIIAAGKEDQLKNTMRSTESVGFSLYSQYPSLTFDQDSSYTTARDIGDYDGDSPITAIGDLRNRLIDLMGMPLSNLGTLQMHDVLLVRRKSSVRELLVYLFEEAVICVAERKTARGILSSTHHSGRLKNALRLKGRLYVREMKQVRISSAVGETSLTIDMENDSSSFDLIFKDQASMELWRNTIKELMTISYSQGSGVIYGP